MFEFLSKLHTMKPALIFLSVLGGFSLWIVPQWPSRLECKGKPLPIAMLPGPKMTGPSLPLRFGGTRPFPGPPVNSFRSETGFRLVIKSQEEFKDFWHRFTSQMPPDSKAPMPEVDFSKHMIVVSAMGQRPTSGRYQIFIDGACEVDGRVEVFVSNVDNPKCIGGFTTLSYPADAVLIPRTDLPVVFRENQISCADWKNFIRYD
jgi:hypothetical protein